MPKRNPIKRKAFVKRIAAHVDQSAWAVERVADQLRDTDLADVLKAEVKLLRRYTQWLRREAERKETLGES